MRLKMLLLALCLAAGVAGAGSLRAPLVRAQSPNPGVVVFDLGNQNISGTKWSFSTDVAVTAGAFEAVTISNYNYCFLGPNDPREGSAHAGAVFWYATLTGPAGPDNVNGMTFDGDLKPGRGGNVKGTVTISTNGDPSNAATHVDATLSGSDLSYYQDNSLKVCLIGSN